MKVFHVLSQWVLNRFNVPRACGTHENCTSRYVNQIAAHFHSTFKCCDSDLISPELSHLYIIHLFGSDSVRIELPNSLNLLKRYTLFVLILSIPTLHKTKSYIVKYFVHVYIFKIIITDLLIDVVTIVQTSLRSPTLVHLANCSCLVLVWY